jgi:hypothetical protein
VPSGSSAENAQHVVSPVHLDLAPRLPSFATTRRTRSDQIRSGVRLCGMSYKLLEGPELRSVSCERSTPSSTSSTGPSSGPWCSSTCRSRYPGLEQKLDQANLPGERQLHRARLKHQRHPSLDIRPRERELLRTLPLPVSGRPCDARGLAAAGHRPGLLKPLEGTPCATPAAASSRARVSVACCACQGPAS